MRALSIEVRVHSQCHTTQYTDISCRACAQNLIILLNFGRRAFHILLTSTGIHSYIHSLPTIIIVDCVGLNSATIYTTCDTTSSFVSQINLLSLTNVEYITIYTWKWQLSAIREVPVSMVSIIIGMTACAQVSVVLYTAITILGTPH